MEKVKVLDGKEVSTAVYQKLEQHLVVLKGKGIIPGLVVILVGDDPASQVYVRKKGKMCEKLGFLSKTIKLESSASETELLKLIDQLNRDVQYHGILVQLPLPAHIDEKKVLLRIDPMKDVDCFHPQNVGRLVSGDPYILPCTPAGIIEMLKYYHIDTEGRHVVILGRSNIVGKPMAILLFQKQKHANATVTVVHSRTQNIEAHTKRADILIAAIGQPQFVTNKMVKKDCVVIDVGMNRVDDPDTEKGYRLVGDVAFESVSRKASAITPVPGGVGLMTVAMLMNNTMIAAAKQNDLTIP